MLVPVIANLFANGRRFKEEVDDMNPLYRNEKPYALNVLGFIVIYGWFAFGFADGGADCMASNDES